MGNDLSNLAPLLAAALGLNPATMLLAAAGIHLGAKLAGRLIPDNKTGVLGAIRKTANVLAVEPSSRLATGVSIKDVANAAAETPAVAEKLPAIVALGETVASDLSAAKVAPPVKSE